MYDTRSPLPAAELRNMALLIIGDYLTDFQFDDADESDRLADLPDEGFTDSVAEILRLIAGATFNYSITLPEDRA